MLERLVEVVENFIEIFFFTTVVREWERGIILRFGRFSRELDPGIHLYFPFHIERPLKTSVVADATQLKEQIFTLCDGTTVAAKAVVTYRIKNVKKHLLEVEDAESSMADATAGVLRRHLSGRSWRDLADPDSCREIEEGAVSEMKREASRWGVEIQRVQFPDLTKVDHVIGLCGGLR